MVLFLNMDWSIEMDVEMLATAFNMSKQEINDCTIIEIPQLTTNTNTNSNTTTNTTNTANTMNTSIKILIFFVLMSLLAI